MQTTLGQFCIDVSDIERSANYYEELMGLTVQHRIEMDEVREVVLGNGSEDAGARIQLAQQLKEIGPIDQATRSGSSTSTPTTVGHSTIARSRPAAGRCSSRSVSRDGR